MCTLGGRCEILTIYLVLCYVLEHDHYYLLYLVQVSAAIQKRECGFGGIYKRQIFE